MLELTAASSSATAGTHTVVVNNLAQTSSGYLDSIANASDALSGSMTIELGNGTTENIVIGAAPAQPAANTIYTGSGKNTLADIATAINSANLGLTANVLADSSGSQLSLVSGTSGAAGKLTVVSSLTDPNIVTTPNPTGTLNYNVGVIGKDASLTIDGAPLTSASNTVTNLIPGVTFQLLAPSAVESGNTLEPVQVVIANDNSGVESTVNQFVTDYNSLISAINTQEGNTSSGTPEPLFGSPTLSLLQQQLLGSLNRRAPTGTWTRFPRRRAPRSPDRSVSRWPAASHCIIPARRGPAPWLRSTRRRYAFRFHLHHGGQRHCNRQCRRLLYPAYACRLAQAITAANIGVWPRLRATPRVHG